VTPEAKNENETLKFGLDITVGLENSRSLITLGPR